MQFYLSSMITKKKINIKSRKCSLEYFLIYIELSFYFYLSVFLSLFRMYTHIYTFFHSLSTNLIICFSVCLSVFVAIFILIFNFTRLTLFTVMILSVCFIKISLYFRNQFRIFKNYF